MSKPRKSQAKRRAVKNAGREIARTHADEDPDVLREASAAIAANQPVSAVDAAVAALDSAVAVYRNGSSSAAYFKAVRHLVNTVRADEHERTMAAVEQMLRYMGMGAS